LNLNHRGNLKSLIKFSYQLFKRSTQYGYF